MFKTYCELKIQKTIFFGMPSPLNCVGVNLSSLVVRKGPWLMNLAMAVSMLSRTFAGGFGRMATTWLNLDQTYVLMTWTFSIFDRTSLVQACKYFRLLDRYWV